MSDGEMDMEEQSDSERPEAADKLANMYRFTSDRDIRRMPKGTFDTVMGMNTRSARVLHNASKKSSQKIKKMFETNTVISIHRGDNLLRVVLTENLPFMCTLCGELYTHTKLLQGHAEQKHGYFQNLVDDTEPRKKPVIIEKSFRKKEDKSAFQSMEHLDLEDPKQEPASSPADQRQQDLFAPSDEDVRITVDGGLPDVLSQKDYAYEKSSISSNSQDKLFEASNPEVDQLQPPDRQEVGVEYILTQLASQLDVEVHMQDGAEDMVESTNNNASAAPETSADTMQEVQVTNLKRKKSGKENYIVVNAEHIVPKENEPKKGKSRPLDKNGEPRKVQVLRPFCVVCHLHCETRVHYREHLADAHQIFQRKRDAEKALEKIKDGNRVEMTESNENPGAAKQSESHILTNNSLDATEKEIIKCQYCDSYVFDEGTLLKHMRAHCGMPGVKCDICQEGIRLWENSLLDQLKDLAERYLSKEQHPQAVDYDTCTSTPLKYPNARVISTCYECNDQFYMRSHMSLHYSKAHESLTCKDCNTVVPTMQALFKHSLKNHKPGIFRCQWCPRNFHDLGKYNYHLQGHMGIYKCPGCGRNFLEKPSLLYHMKKYEKCPQHFQGCQTITQEISLEKPFVSDGIVDHQNRTTTVVVCDLCNATFVNKGNYTRHMNTVHPGHGGATSMENSFVCDICGNVFWSKTNLKVHMKIHNKKFPCNFTGCSKRFWSQGMLKKHMETHENAPTYFCDDCGKTFQHSGSLRFHKRTHTDKKSKCDICHEVFKGRRNLSNHMQEVHYQELSFTCGICEKSFTSRRRLLAHAKIHSDRQKNFMCEKCPCAFTEKRLLVQHQRVHNKTYPCIYCHKSYNKLNALKNHHLKDHTVHMPPDPASVQTFEGESIEIQVQELADAEGGVVIVEYPAGDDGATDRAIAAIVSELQGS